MSMPVPKSIAQVAALDPALGAEIQAQFERLARAGGAMVWANQKIQALSQAQSAGEVLRVVVDEARNLTEVPVVWALRWSGTPSKGISFKGLIGAGQEEGLPPPSDISGSVVGQVAEQGAPAWSDDAAADARFVASQSVVRWSLRSVGCVPIGPKAVLYWADPDAPGRFDANSRARITALCSLASVFLTYRAPAPRPRQAEGLPGLVGQAPAMQELYETARAFAPMPWPVLVLGETGTGKEGVANAIHSLSLQKGQPFLAVNCGAIPETLAESTLFGHERGAFTGADRMQQGIVERVGQGTLFLDEVAELSPQIQVKLLRLLQERTYERVGGSRTLPFRGRIVAATHRSLDDAEGRGDFREDLYYRLAACVIHVPALRERRSDIESLAHHLLGKALKDLPGAPQIRFSQPAIASLRHRDWPGNVRELENTIRGAIARAMGHQSTLIELAHFPPALNVTSAPKSSLDEDLQAATEAFQKARVYAALENNSGNRTQAAKQLGVSRQWLHRLLSRWEGP
ncbi:MAG: AAA domain-containing protein [Rhodobacterales bacterium]|nr:AAA domain-containing protein [Rhodobacterales bacterium]